MSGEISGELLKTLQEALSTIKMRCNSPRDVSELATDALDYIARATAQS